jgi:hypothetical protein
MRNLFLLALFVNLFWGSLQEGYAGGRAVPAESDDDVKTYCANGLRTRLRKRLSSTLAQEALDQAADTYSFRNIFVGTPQELPRAPEDREAIKALFLVGRQPFLSRLFSPIDLSAFKPEVALLEGKFSVANLHAHEIALNGATLIKAGSLRTKPLDEDDPMSPQTIVLFGKGGVLSSCIVPEVKILEDAKKTTLKSCRVGSCLNWGQETTIQKGAFNYLENTSITSAEQESATLSVERTLIEEYLQEGGESCFSWTECVKMGIHGGDSLISKSKIAQLAQGGGNISLFYSSLGSLHRNEGNLEAKKISIIPPP